jgi:hypothetical protein
MNERIRLLAEQAKKHALDAMIKIADKEQALKVYSESYDTEFAELIVQECRTVINDVYHKTPLELCGPLLTVDEEIMNHFYGVEKLT